MIAKPRLAAELRAVLAGACMLLAPGHSALAAELEHPDISVAVAGVASDLDKLVYAAALAKGYFREEGLNVTSLDMLSGSKALQALVGGSVDLVEGAYEHTLRMKAQGVNLTCIAVFDKVPGIVLMAVNASKDRVKSAADLKGKKIGVSAPGSGTYTLAVQYLQQAGLTAKDASFIAVGVGANALAAVRSGNELDALSTIDPAVTELTRTGEAVVVADTRTQAGVQSVYGGSYPLGCLYAKSEFVKQNPKTTQAVANAITHAMKWLQSAPVDEIAAAFPKTYYTDLALYREVLSKNLEAVRWDGIVTPDMPKTVLRSLEMSDPKLAQAHIDPAGTYDNEWTRRALEKFR